MKDVVTTSAVFFNYALLAVFAQNAVFTRALGVSRLVQLVGDDRTSSWLFGMQLCITQILVTPFAWYAGSRIAPLANRAQLRPLVYIASIAVVCLLEHAVLWLAKGLPHRSALLRIVPLAGLNSCVLGTVLVERTQSFTLGQSLGFGLGSGLGYVLAIPCKLGLLGVWIAMWASWAIRCVVFSVRFGSGKWLHKALTSR